MNNKSEKKHADILFSFLKKRVREIKASKSKPESKAFIHWFIETHYSAAYDIQITDGPFDGKIDGIARIEKSNQVHQLIINSKYTGRFDALAPKKFYEEISEFSKPFIKPSFREFFLANKVKEELQGKYRELYSKYDDQNATLIFITNHKKNSKFCRTTKYKGVRVFHYDDLRKYLLDDIDGALPKTEDLKLQKISRVLKASKKDTEVPTSITFARIRDFLNYMDKDNLGTLFSRNVRIALAVKKNSVNESIMETFKENPEEFTYSNNGITLICDSAKPYKNTLTLKNPRVVNGSQTLHSVKKALSIKKLPNDTDADVKKKRKEVLRAANLARVMVKIIEVPLHAADASDTEITRKKNIVNNIAKRTNQQNPIKRSDLSANDEHQLSIFRYLKARGYYYDRRIGEWKKNIRSNRDRGLKLGPNIRLAMQLAASIHPELGPAIAKLAVDGLFAKPYEKIKDTNPETILQAYLLFSQVKKVSNRLSNRNSDIRELKGHYDFALFEAASRAFRTSGLHLGDIRHFSRLRDCIDNEEQSTDLRKKWNLFVTEISRSIWPIYNRSNTTPNNFFKTSGHVEGILERKLPKKISRLAKDLLTTIP